MRSRETLMAIESITLLYQYLYMDENHSITFNNGVTDLTIHMTDNLSVMCKNLRYPDLPESDWTENFTPHNCLNIIEILKTMPVEEYKEPFENRWEEIKSITSFNLALNRNNSRRRIV